MDQLALVQWDFRRMRNWLSVDFLFTHKEGNVRRALALSIKTARVGNGIGVVSVTGQAICSAPPVSKREVFLFAHHAVSLFISRFYFAWCFQLDALFQFDGRVFSLCDAFGVVSLGARCLHYGNICMH